MTGEGKAINICGQDKKNWKQKKTGEQKPRYFNLSTHKGKRTFSRGQYIFLKGSKSGKAQANELKRKTI